MSIYTELNKSTVPEYFDEEAGIRYVFVDMGFIPYEEKLRLIALYGSPRKTKKEIKTELVSIEGVAQKFEIQMIGVDSCDQESPGNP